MHPSLRIALYLISALALPGLNFFGLTIAAVLSLLLLHRHSSGAFRLVRRARWLFLLLGLGYAYSQPGPIGIPLLGQYSPSAPGLWLGATQMLRLFLLLWLLDGLVIAMPETRLMSGLYGVFSLIGRIGFPVERTTVRLGLTLQAMEGNLGLKKGLREACAIPEQPEGGSFHLTPEPWRVADSLVLLAAFAALVIVWLV